MVEFGPITSKILIDIIPFQSAMKAAADLVKAFGKTASIAANVVRRAFTGMRTAARLLGRTIGVLARGIGRLIRRFFSLRGIINAVIVGFSARQFLKFTAGVDNARASFTNFTSSLGIDGPKALIKFRDAAKGTISTLNIFRQFNTSVALGVVKTTEDFEKFITISRRLGRALGVDAGQALQDLTTGVARQSKQILDNLGIIVNAEEAYDAYATSIGKVSKALTDNERRLAFQEAAFRAAQVTIERLGEDTDTFADAFARFNVNIQNAALLLAVISSGPLADLFNTLADVRLIGAVKILGSAIKQMADSLTVFVMSGGGRAFSSFLEGIATFAGTAGIVLTELTLIIGRFLVAVKEKGFFAAFTSAGLRALRILMAGFEFLFSFVKQGVFELAAEIAGALGSNLLAGLFESKARQAGFDRLINANRLNTELFGDDGILAPLQDSLTRFFSGEGSDASILGDRVAKEVEEGATEGLKKAAQAPTGIRDAVGSFFGDIGTTLSQALRAGADPIIALANLFGQQLDKVIGETFTNLGKSLTDVFSNFFNKISDSTGRLLGSIASFAIGLIGAFIAREKQRGSQFTEAPVDDIATASSEVRGVVAGPTTIPIAEVGTSLRESLRGTEALLRSIDETLKSIETSGFSALGASAAGAVNT